jgi:small subunit ribosomal protein S13
MAVRIAGVNLPNDQRVAIGLTAVYGVGRSRAAGVLKETGVSPDMRVKDLAEPDVKKLREAVEGLRVEGDLRREVTQNIKRLQDVGTYRGIRHAKKLPAHGQRTKTNARTKRGKRVTVGSGKIKAAAKT